nr:MAG TPA: hypothetical protein [Caudoviricetes sp.]
MHSPSDCLAKCIICQIISFVKLHKISPSVGAPELIRSYRVNRIKSA